MAKANTKVTTPNEFTVVEFNENGACEYTIKSRGTQLTIKTEDISQGWEVMGVNAASRAYRSMGSYKAFNTLADAEVTYKGLAGIELLHTSLCASAFIKRIQAGIKA